MFPRATEGKEAGICPVINLCTAQAALLAQHPPLTLLARPKKHSPASSACSQEEKPQGIKICWKIAKPQSDPALGGLGRDPLSFLHPPATKPPTATPRARNRLGKHLCQSAQPAATKGKKRPERFKSKFPRFPQGRRMPAHKQRETHFPSPQKTLLPGEKYNPHPPPSPCSCRSCRGR